MEDRVYADLQKTDRQRRLLLTTVGTQRDINVKGIQLREGLRLTFHSGDLDSEGNRDDLVSEGTVHHDSETNTWVAEIDWDAIRHQSDIQKE
ncbi:MAG TPA: hypothetical protein VJ913_10445 [Actinomycetota bacterium]|nr:hypothetical protein [Actinomycetota bacterium]